MRQAANRELFSYWRSLKGFRGAPERNDVDPGAIRAILADVFILEFDLSVGLPFRIAGTRTNALFGRELRGKPFLDLWRRADRADIADLAESCLDGCVPVLAAGLARPPTQSGIAVEILFLPLRHHGNTHARLLGAFAPSAMPRWIGLEEVDEVEYLTSRVLRDGPLTSTEDDISPLSRLVQDHESIINRRRQLYVISRNL